MGIVRKFLTEEEACEVAPPDGTACDGTAITLVYSGVSTGETGSLLHAASTNAPGGLDAGFPEYFFEEPFGGNQFGPITAANAVANFSTLPIVNGPNAGAVIEIDWSNFANPQFSISTNPPPTGALTLNTAIRARDACNNTQLRRWQLNFQSATTAPASPATIFFTGDNSNYDEDGISTTPVTPNAGGSAAGFTGMVGQVRNATNTGNLAAEAGSQIEIILFDGTNNRKIISAVFDYSGTIVMNTSVPVSEDNPVYTRTDGSTIQFTWAQFMPLFNAFSQFNGGNGSFAIAFNKRLFAQTYLLSGCKVGAEGNAVQLNWSFRIKRDGTAFSPLTTMPTLFREEGGSMAQPYAITQDTQTGIVFATDTSTTEDQVFQLEEVLPGVWCRTTLPEFRDQRNAVPGHDDSYNFQSILVDTSRVVNGRNPIYGNTYTATDGSFFVAIWNPATAQWDLTFSGPFPDVGARVIRADYTKLHNGRPIHYNVAGGNTSGIWLYDGTGESYTLVPIASPPFGSGNGRLGVEVDPDTGIVYGWAGSGSSGQQNFWKAEFAGGDVTDAANWSTSALGFHQNGNNVGPLDSNFPATNGTATSCYDLMYTGRRVNGEPEFFFTDNGAYIKRLFFNGTDWEIDIVAGNGVLSTVPGQALGGASFRGTQEIERLSDGRIGIMCRVGSAFHIWDETTGEVIVAIQSPSSTGQDDNFYY